MTVKIGGLIVAEGEEKELAIYTALVLDILKAVTDAHEEEKAKKDIEFNMELARMTLDELMKREMEDDKDCGTS